MLGKDIMDSPQCLLYLFFLECVCVCFNAKILLPKQYEGILQCQRARELPTTEVESHTDGSVKELPLANVVKM